MHTTWKTIKKGKYLYAKIPNHPNATNKGYVLEHRAEMEKYLGRYLPKDEIIHHIDGNTHNNNITNLRVMSYSDHNNLHKPALKMQECVCPNCGVVFLRRPKGKYDIGRIPKCSRKCNGEYSKKIQLGLV